MTDKRKPKVLQICDKLGISDSSIHGVSRLLLWWLPQYVESDYEVKLIELRIPSKATAVFKGQGASVDSLSRGKYDPRTLTDLIKIIKHEKADILHCHGYGSTTFGRVAGLLTRTPVIVHEHMIDKSIPLHQVFIDKLLSPMTARAIAVAVAVKDFMHEKRGLPRNKIDVIYNGLPLEYCKEYSVEEKQVIRQQLNISEASIIISIIGRLDPIKGHKVLIKALSQLKRLQQPYVCLVVGDGELMASLTTLASNLGLNDSIRFLGFCGDISNILSVTDILAISSYSEGCPLSVLEGMAAGKAIVSTAVGGIPELLNHQENAILVPSGQPDAMADALEKLIGNDQLRASLGQRAKKKCMANYLVTHTIDQMGDVYKSILTP